MIDDIDVEEPDWAPLEKYPANNEIQCCCGKVFCGRVKGITVPPPRNYMVVSQGPCPGCGKRTTVSRVSSQPESYALGRE